MAIYQNFKYFYYKHILPCFCFEISKKVLPLRYVILTFLQITQTLQSLKNFNVIADYSCFQDIKPSENENAFLQITKYKEQESSV